MAVFLLLVCLFFFLSGRWTAPYLASVLFMAIALGWSLQFSTLGNSYVIIGAGLLAGLPVIALTAVSRRWVLPLFTGLGPVLLLMIFIMAGWWNFNRLVALVVCVLGIALAYVFPKLSASIFSIVCSTLFFLLLTQSVNVFSGRSMLWVIPLMMAGLLFQLLVLPRLEKGWRLGAESPAPLLHRYLDPYQVFPKRWIRIWAMPLVVVVFTLLFHTALVLFCPAATIPAQALYVQRFQQLNDHGLVIGRDNVFYLTGRNTSCRIVSGTAGRSRLAGLIRGLPVLDRKANKLRAVKDDEEVACLGRACQITAAALLECLSQLGPGMTELRLQETLLANMRRLGAEDEPAFAQIIATGRNALSPHYNLCWDTLKSGDLVVFDIGCKFQGYAADMTRTLPADGKFTPDQLFYYRAVLAVQKAALAGVRAGVSLKQLEGEARNSLKKLNLNQYFTHSLGHHVGLDVHDPYYDFNSPLKEGMVITIEPGVYLPEKGYGIRIEDTVLVEKNGCRVLTADFPKEPDEIERLLANRR